MTIEIQGSGTIQAKLKALARQAGRKVTGIVGYGMGYAIYVHEDLEAQHPVGQAKFLETPMRREGHTLLRIVADEMRKSKNLKAGVLKACLYLQARSQELCPVDTGALRASAFSRVEE